MNQVIDTRFVLALDPSSITYRKRGPGNPFFKTDMLDTLNFMFKNIKGEKTLKEAEDFKEDLIGELNEDILSVEQNISEKIRYDSSLSKLLDEESDEILHLRRVIKTYQRHMRLINKASIYEAQADWRSVRFIKAKKVS